MGQFQKGHTINKGRKHSAETKRKMSETHRGMVHKNMGIYKRVKPHWSKGLKIGFVSKTPEETRMKMSLAHKGINKGEKSHLWKGGPNKRSCEICNKNFSDYPTNRKRTCSMLCHRELIKTPEWRFNLSQKHKERVAKGLNNLYMGGITRVNKLIRQGVQFKLWRESVFERDDWTCQECKIRGGRLHPHHIKPFALFPELRFAIDNGLTLCEQCHRKTDSWGPRLLKNKERKAIMKKVRSKRKWTTN